MVLGCLFIYVIGAITILLKTFKFRRVEPKNGFFSIESLGVLYFIFFLVIGLFVGLLYLLCLVGFSVHSESIVFTQYHYDCFAALIPLKVYSDAESYRKLALDENKNRSGIYR